MDPLTKRIEHSEAESIEIQRRSDIAFAVAHEVWRLRRRVGEVEAKINGRWMSWNLKGAALVSLVGFGIQVGFGGWSIGWGALLAIGGLLWLISSTQESDRLNHQLQILESELDLHRTTWDSVSGGLPFQSLLALQFHGNTDPNCDDFRNWRVEVLTSITSISAVGFERKVALADQVGSDWMEYKKSKEKSQDCKN